MKQILQNLKTDPQITPVPFSEATGRAQITRVKGKREERSQRSDEGAVMGMGVKKE